MAYMMSIKGSFKLWLNIIALVCVFAGGVMFGAWCFSDEPVLTEWVGRI